MLTLLAGWCSAMAQFVRGWIFLSNMLYDCAKRRVAGHVLKQFLQEIAREWKDAHELVKPHDLVRKVVDGDPDTYLCCGPNTPLADRGCSRVMVVLDLLHHNIDRTKIPFTIRGRITPTQIRLMETLGLRDAATQSMSNGRGFAWVTKTDSLSEIRTRVGPSDLPSVVRTELGLNHFQEDQHLVEIRYPDRATETATMTAPTFLDACAGLCYRSTAGSDGWGRAVHLNTLADGLPEAVHLELAFTDEFTIADVGRLGPADSAFDWDAFRTTLPRPWDPSRLMELLSHA